MIKLIKNSFKIIINPNVEFDSLFKKSFETVLKNYLYLIIFAGILSGLTIFLLSFGKAIYYSFFMKIDINYINMLNYNYGRFISTVFFYLFAGTFLIAIIGLIIKPFTKGIKFTNVLKIIFYSLTPLILFSWIQILTPGLIVWSLSLLIIGLKKFKEKEKIKKSSIEQRD